jgi:serine/threonine-protein kinase
MHAPDFEGTRYTILRHLARGGMGSVWLAEDAQLKRRVAIKVLDLVTSSDDLAARLLQEARILAGLEHPGIVPVHDAGMLADGRAFYCMKFVEGLTLQTHAAGKSLPEKLRLLGRIAEPVEFAHARGVLHRDLKPDNIMIGAFGEVLVMDWGLSKIAEFEPTAFSPVKGNAAPSAVLPRAAGRGSVLGTPGYMSPEQSRGDSEVDHRSDIYSLGAILWFLLTGSAPAEPISDKFKIPRPLRAISLKAMAPRPDARYQAAGEMMQDVACYLNGDPVSAHPEGVLERMGRLYARHRTAVVLLGAYLLMRLLFILFARR